MSETRNDQKVDEASKESFPASDAPAITPPEGSRRAETPAHGADVAMGLPSSDRQHTETAAARSAGKHPAETHPHTSDQPLHKQ